MRFSRTIQFLIGGAVPLLIAVGGCTPEAYRRSADRQVFDVLRDRERQTLGYTPQVEVADPTVPLKPAPPAYEKIPSTTMPTGGLSPVEPAVTELPLRPFGPEMLAPAGTTGPSVESLGAEAQRRIDEERMVLGPPAPRELPMRLDLFSALAYATQNSRSYQSQMEELYLATLDVTLERHLFSPRPFVRQDFLLTGGEEDVDYRSALTATTSAGVSQRLPYGGEVVARTLVTFVDTLNGEVVEGESAQAVLSASVPLLRGAGLVNLEPLIQTERALVYEVRNFEDFRRSFAVEIASAYFELLAVQQQVENRETQYSNYLSLTERVQAHYAAGKTAFLEVQRSLHEQLQAENSLIVAQSQYQTAVDQFKLRLGMPVEEELEVVPVELDLKLPEINREEVIETATTYRLDLQTARDQIEDAQRAVQVAENGLLPDVDLTAEGRIGNPVDLPARRIDDRTLNYAAGVSIDLPIDRLPERNEYRRSLIQLQRTQRNYEQARDQVLADVANAVRRIQAAEISVQIQARGIELARRRLEFANELLRQGDAEAREVVEAQEDLLEAQDTYEQAKANLQIELLNFLQSTGTLRVDPEAGSIGQALTRSDPDNRQQRIGAGGVQ